MSDPLAALRARFLARAAEDAAVLGDSATPDEERRIRVHRLAGAAGVFGFHELGEQAAALDEAWQAGRSPTPAELADLVRALSALPPLA